MSKYRFKMQGPYRSRPNRRGAFHTSVTTGGYTRSYMTFEGVEKVYNNIIDAHDHSCDELGNLCGKWAKKLARESKQNASWNDREERNAGVHARDSITGRVSHKEFATSIVVKGGEGVYDVRNSGNRPYYHYLEEAMGKTFATIKPTVNSRAPTVIFDIGNRFLRG